MCVVAAHPRAQLPGLATALAAAREAFNAGRYDEARSLAQMFRDDEQMVALRARTFSVQGQYDEAEAALVPFARENPGSEAALELGLLERHLGRRAEGRRTLEFLRIALGPNPRDPVRAGRAAREVGRFEEAKARFNDAVAAAPTDPAANTAWGEMLLEKHNVGEAVQSFRIALKTDPDYQPALLGLARALMTTNPPEAITLAEQVVALNASNPDGHVLLAELAIDEDRRDDAAASLARALAVNPRHLDALAFKAALAFVDGRTADYDAAVAEALAVNPRYGEVYRVTGEVAARYYRFDEAAAEAQKAIELDPENSRAEADLGAHLMRTGDEETARRALERAFRADPYDAYTYNLLGLLDALDGFETLHDGDLVVKLHRDEAPVMGQYAPQLAREALEALSKRWQFTPTGPILVELFPNHDDFAVRNVGLPGMIGALGACFGRVVTMDSPKARPPGDFNWGATLWHEMAHVITLQLSKQRVPRWLTEGISVFEETRAPYAWGREMEIPFVRALDAGEAIPLATLNAAFQDPRTISLAYYEASLLVEHIVEAHGDPTLRALVEGFADGSTTEEVIARVLHVDMAALQASFDAFLETKFGALRTALETPEGLEPGLPLDKVRALADATPGSFAVQMALGQALRETDPKGAITAFEKAATLVPMFTGPESPYAQIVEVALKLGDKARAARALETLTKYDSTDVASARQLAGLLDAPEDEARLGDALRKVVAVDPFDAAAHTTLGRMAIEAGDAPAAVRNFRVALAAGALDPASAHADLAESLLLTGARDEAKRQTLAALEVAPTYARAQELLLKIVDEGGQ